MKIFQDALKKDKLELRQLRSLAFEGIPEVEHLRPTYWKASLNGKLNLLSKEQILLNYLPLDRTSWPTYLQKQRKMYDDWVKELVIDPHEKVLSGSSSILNVLIGILVARYC